jgi:uncharacterized membrane protein (UPF0127 family)
VGAINVLPDGARARAVNTSRPAVLAERIEIAATPWQRMRGLLGRPPLGPGQGLLIVPCQGVHTLGMAYPIDVVHLDRQGIVRHVSRGLKPWRIGPMVWRAYQALELPAGAAVSVSVGDRVTLEPTND